MHKVNLTHILVNEVKDFFLRDFNIESKSSQSKTPLLGLLYKLSFIS